MACPTCDHTMQGILIDENAKRAFWCPRCGTLRIVSLYGDTEEETAEAPSQSRLLGDAVMFVRRMTRMLEGNAIHSQAMAWLRKHNLEGSILRDE